MAMDLKEIVAALAIVGAVGSNVPLIGGMLVGITGILALINLVLVFWNPLSK